jgi:hypothetical protein
MILENPYLKDACSVNQSDWVTVACGRQAFVRSHPSTLGAYVTTVYGGQKYRKLNERWDSPTIGTLASSQYVLIASNTDDVLGWVRRTDSTGTPNLVDGEIECPPGTLVPTPIPPPTTPDFGYGAPANTRGGIGVAGCFTGTELAPVPNSESPCSKEYIVAFVIACEAGVEQYLGDEQAQQAMVDIAHVIHSRMRAGGFPDNAFDVVRQAGQFQCFCEGANPSFDSTSIDLARNLAETLVIKGKNGLLPPASFPEVENALYFMGVSLDATVRSDAAANAIEPEDMATYLISGHSVGVEESILVGGNNIGGIYLGHGPISRAKDGAEVVFGTVFFSDDPRFTGEY